MALVACSIECKGVNCYETDRRQLFQRRSESAVHVKGAMNYVEKNARVLKNASVSSVAFNENKMLKIFKM